MKSPLTIQINLPALRYALDQVKSTIPSKTSHDVLKNIMLRIPTDGTDAASISTTNLEQSSRALIRVSPASYAGAEGAQVLLPAKEMLSAAGRMRGEVLSLTVNDGRSVDLVCGRIRVTLPYTDPATFPATEFGEDLEWHELGDIQDAFSSVQRAISSDSSRPHLTGAVIDFGPVGDRSEGGVCVAATDGHRISYTHTPAEKDALGFLSSAPEIVPMPMVHDIARLEWKSPQFAIDSAKSRFILRSGCGGYWKSSALIAGSFPVWRQVIPYFDSNLPHVRVMKSDLADALSVANDFTDARRRLAIFTITATEIRIETNANDTTSAQTIPCTPLGEWPDDELSVCVGMNTAYTRDALAALEGPEMIMWATHELKPVLIWDAEDSGVYARHIVMPMRI